MNLVKFSDVVRRANTKEDRFDTEKEFYVGGEHIETDDPLITQRGIIKGSLIGPMFYCGFKKDDVLFVSRNPHLRKCGQVTFDGICSEKTFVLETKDENILAQAYLPFVMQNDRFWSYMETHKSGSVNYFINWSTLADYTFDLPPIEEQKQLATVLWSMVRTREAYRRLLEKTDELVEARFREMFGDSISNGKNWDIQELGSLCKISRGGSPRPIEKFLGGTIPWIKIGDATDDDKFYLTSTREHIIEEGIKKSRLVKAGSLIFANCGVSLGFARIITFDGCIHDGWLALEDIDARLNKIFLLFSLNQMTAYFRRIAPYGTQPNLNINIMKAHKQILPPIELQNQFIDFIRQADQSKSALQHALVALQKTYRKLVSERLG